jgi:hypothetical protein
MKIKISELRNIIKEELEKSSLLDEIPDEEGGMAKSSLMHISKRAKSVYDILNHDEQLPAWIQDKIAVMNHSMTAIYDYIDSRKNSKKD